MLQRTQGYRPWLFFILFVSCLTCIVDGFVNRYPVVVNTWDFTAGTESAWEALIRPGARTPALDAVEKGCSTCEMLQCGGTVGFGGSPDEGGEVSLDAVIMDGVTMDAGAVASLQHVNQAISAARFVMERTTHTMLAGLRATQFAIEMGLNVANLSTGESNRIYREWKARNCQPNFRRNVKPDPAESCGPYSAYPLQHVVDRNQMAWVDGGNHDTISIVAIDEHGNIAAGSSSNGATHKVSGRVGDAAVPGAGAYADNNVGGCGATGDGDIHLRFMLCYQVVENMRLGLDPSSAAEDALRRIAVRTKATAPHFTSAVVAVDTQGNHGAAAYGWTFKYAVRSWQTGKVDVITVEPFTLKELATS